MKFIRYFIIALFVLLVAAPVVLAQENGVELDTDSAVGLIQSLWDNREAVILIIVGILSSQLIKYGSHFKWLGNLAEPLRKTVVYGASLILPFVFSWVYTVLMPVAKYIDANGYWPVITALFLLIYGGQYVTYLAEKFPRYLAAAIAGVKA